MREMAKSEDPRDLKSERRAWRRETAAAASLGGESSGSTSSSAAAGAEPGRRGRGSREQGFDNW